MTGDDLCSLMFKCAFTVRYMGRNLCFRFTFPKVSLNHRQTWACLL